MDLSAKATRFMLEALEHYLKYHDQQLDSETRSDDERSDLLNDRQYLQAVIQDFQKHQKPATGLELHI